MYKNGKYAFTTTDAKKNCKKGKYPEYKIPNFQKESLHQHT